MVSRAYRNGTTAAYTYNANDWMLSLEHTVGAVRIAGFGHVYDNEGNKTFEEQRHNPTRSEAYAYDAINRLVDYKVGTLVGSTVPAPITQTAYSLDALGNWDSKTTDGVTETRVHDVVNELRRVIEDNPDDPILIRTIPKAGYQFTGVVEEIPDAPAP